MDSCPYHISAIFEVQSVPFGRYALVPPSPTIARATRFSLPTRIRYQRAGDDAWSTGTTINLSRDGVLFAGARLLPAGTSLRAAITLTRSAVEILCTGNVVRVETATATNRFAMAATVDFVAIRRTVRAS